MSSFEIKMHRDGRIYGWSMLLAICAFPLFASIKLQHLAELRRDLAGCSDHVDSDASYVLSEMIAFRRFLVPEACT